MSRPDPGVREAAEILAIQALGFLAEDPSRLARFLAMSGVGPQRIRAAASDPAFLAGVLDHVASDESLLIAFAEHAGITPAAVKQAHAALAGPPWEREVP